MMKTTRLVQRAKNQRLFHMAKTHMRPILDIKRSYTTPTTGSVPSLRQVYSKQFVSEPALKENGKTGLFDIDMLKIPEDVIRFQQYQMNKCNALIDQLKAYNVNEAYNASEFVDIADQLSNELCIFLDLAEAIRNIHQSKKWVNIVNDSYDAPKMLMHRLNADKDIQQKIKTVHGNPMLEGEQKRVMEKLMEDMEDVDGMENTEELTNVNQQLDQIQYQFIQASHTSPDHLYIPRKGSFGLKKHKISSQKGRQILYYSPDQEERKEVYLQLNTPNPAVKGMLRQMQKLRQKKADLLGYPTHNHLVLEQNVLTNPDEVISFLDGVNDALQPQLEIELEAYRKKREQLRKQGQWTNATTTDDIYEWDTSYLGGHMDHLSETSSSHFFSVHNAMQGLTILCKEVFGIDLLPESLKYGEVFDPTIRKFSLNRHGRILGEIYFDLYARPNKPFEGVNFTIQVGRQASNQIARLVVSASFGRRNAFPDLHSDILSYSQLATLFHEFGHSMHAILGTTAFQVHSGFRTSVDFSEIPSHVLEHFLTDYDFVQRWAVDQEGNTIGKNAFYQMVQSYHNSSGVKLLNDIIYARFDIELWNNPKDDPAHIYEQVHRHYSPFKAEYGQHYQISSHLTNYGSMLYAYVYCQVVASQIYVEQFEQYKGNTNGPRYMDELLGPGGSIPSREILTNYMGTVQPDPHRHINFFTKFQ